METPKLLSITTLSRIAQSGETGVEAAGSVMPSAGAAPSAIGKVVRVGTRIIQIASDISSEGWEYIKDDWEEIKLDLEQLGLTLAGLLEVPVASNLADAANGVIDIRRGHPILGAISIFSAIPIVGLLGGIPLSLVRGVKVICSALKGGFKVFIAFVVKPGVKVVEFIWLRRGILLSYSQRLGKFIVNSTGKAIEGLPRVSDKLMGQLKQLSERLAKEPTTPLMPEISSSPGHFAPLKDVMLNNMKNMWNSGKGTSSKGAPFTIDYTQTSVNKMLYQLKSRL